MIIPAKQINYPRISRADKARWNDNAARFLLVSPQDKELLEYDTTAQKWTNRAKNPPVRLLFVPQYAGNENPNDLIVHARSQFVGLDNRPAPKVEIITKSHNWLTVTVNEFDFRVQISNRPLAVLAAFVLFRVTNQDNNAEDFRYDFSFPPVVVVPSTSIAWAARRLAVDLDAAAQPVVISWSSRRLAVDLDPATLPPIVTDGGGGGGGGGVPTTTGSDPVFGQSLQGDFYVSVIEGEMNSHLTVELYRDAQNNLWARDIGTNNLTTTHYWFSNWNDSSDCTVFNEPVLPNVLYQLIKYSINSFTNERYRVGEVAAIESELWFTIQPTQI